MLVGLLALGASRPVAMRVEVAPLRAEGQGTAVEIVVQVAPEDRSRIGRTVWLQGELSRGGSTVVRLARGVELDAQGRVQLELTLEPGSYDLGIELQAGQGGVSGFWKGSAVVPRLEPGEAPPVTAAAVVAAARPAPAPATSPAPEAAPASQDVPDRPAEPADVGEAPVAEPAAAAETTARLAPQPSLPPTTTAGRDSAPEAASAASAPSPPSEAPPSPSPAPVAVPTPVPVVVAAAAPTPRPHPPLLDPDRWGADASDLADLTVWVEDRGRPVAGLERGAFRIELDGDQAAIEDFGDASRAPLYLGFVVHVAPETLNSLSGLQALLGRLAIQASGDRGSALVMADDSSGAAPIWGASADRVAALLRSSAEGGQVDLAGMVVAALNGLAERRGRRVLVVVADGGDGSERSGWKAAVDRAEGAGVPVLVVGVEGGRLESATRKGLERVVDASGGAAYFPRLSDSGLLELVADLYADTVAATYDLRVARPASGDASKVKVEVLGGQTEARHSRRLR